MAISRSGPGVVRLCCGAVAGVGEQLADPAGLVTGAGGRGGLVRGDQRGGVLGFGEHRLEPLGVGGVLGKLGSDDQLVFAGHVLGVVALDEPAAAHGHQPGVRVGDVAHRARALVLVPRGLACGLSGSGLGFFQGRAGGLDQAVVLDPGAGPVPAAARYHRPGGAALQLGQLHRPGRAGTF